MTPCPKTAPGIPPLWLPLYLTLDVKFARYVESHFWERGNPLPTHTHTPGSLYNVVIVAHLEMESKMATFGQFNIVYYLSPVSYRFLINSATSCYKPTHARYQPGTPLNGICRPPSQGALVSCAPWPINTPSDS